MKKELLTQIVQWDVGTWSNALHFWENSIDWSNVKSGLELGGNQGGLSLWLALKGIKVVCSDLKNTKSSAEYLHQEHAVCNLIEYQDIDATNIPYENQFDLIVFKSILGGIGRDDNFDSQKKVFNGIHRALKPNGRVLFAENLIASPLHQFFRKKFVKWGNTWRYVTVEETKELLENFSSYQIKTTGILGTFGRNESQRNLLSKLDNILLNELLPDSWKYVVYGTAIK